MAPEIDARPWVNELSARQRNWAEREGLVYVDHFAAMADKESGMRAEFSRDGVHPNRRSYAAMRQVFESSPSWG